MPHMRFYYVGLILSILASISTTIFPQSMRPEQFSDPSLDESYQNLSGCPEMAKVRKITPPPAIPQTSLSWEEIRGKLPGRNLGSPDKGGARLPGNPLNLVFIGNARRIIEILRKASWESIGTNLGLSSLESSFECDLQQVFDGKKNQFTHLPMVAYYLPIAGIARVQDFNWAMTEKSFSARHHFRLWKTEWKDSEAQGREVWWGSADHDTSIRWRSFPRAHNTDPETWKEREFIDKTLSSIPGVTTRTELFPQVPVEGVNDRDCRFKTDQKVLIVDIKDHP